MSEPFELAEDRDAWERQPGESAKAFDAFIHYRDLPASERSVDRAYRTSKGLQKDSSTRALRNWFVWCKTFVWVERAGVFDRHVDRVRIERKQEEARLANDRHIETARVMQERALQSVYGLKYKAAVQDVEVELEPLTPSEARKWLVSGVDLERKALGIPDVVRNEISGPGGGPVQTEIIGIEIVQPPAYDDDEEEE